MRHRPKYFFLLGGHDLEMSVIRSVLSDNGYDYADNSLAWDTAKVSSYKSELEKYGDTSGYMIYGIELSEDMELPSNYTRIDHHNDYDGRKTSLQQIMDMLDIPMTRFHRLVAANDEAYIPGMQASGATDSEIRHIRLLDRQAQGVTDKDEKLAEESVLDNKSMHGSLCVVKSLTHKFSPICDRLFPYTSLLIYTDDDWTFYGAGSIKIRHLFNDEVSHGKVYCGGGGNGYVGSVRNKWSKNEIISHIKKIIHEFE